MDPKAKNQQNQTVDPVNPQVHNPVSSGNPEVGPIQEVERPVSDYSSYPAPPSNTPVLQPTPAVKISDDLASQPSLKNIKGNIIDLEAAREKFKKGDIKESGTWEAGEQVYGADKTKAKGEQKKAA